MYALQRDRRQMSPDDFPEQLAELLAYFEDDFPDEHLFARLAALPGAPGRPDVWLLGSSPQSAIWAAELGLPYSVADFINPDGAENARLYRDRFAPSRRREQPETTVCVSAICAETDEEARRLAASQRMAITLLRRGQVIAVPPVEKALAFLAEAGIGEGAGGRRAVVGTPDAVRAGLEEVAAEYGADEVLVVTITHDHGARRRSYELLAEAFGLRARAHLGFRRRAQVARSVVPGSPPHVCVFAPAPILTVVIERGTADAGELHIHPGGQGFWVARMLSELGGEDDARDAAGRRDRRRLRPPDRPITASTCASCRSPSRAARTCTIAARASASSGGRRR